jgi:hypothetical protein
MDGPSPLPDTKFHGAFFFPLGSKYRLASVPWNAPLKFAGSTQFAAETRHIGRLHKPSLAASYNVPKLLLSFAQAVWASVTLYQARGDQIDEYGYAAFGLTVAPYAWMSMVNLVANLLTPAYPVAFLVRTPAMDEAEAAGCCFSGEILVAIDHDGEWRGAVDRTPRRTDDQMMRVERDTNAMRTGLLLGLIPLAIIGALSRFQAGNSTSLQRGFTMSWLVLGIFFGFFFEDFSEPPSSSITQGTIGGMVNGIYLGAAIGGCSAIGGMVVVGQMIQDFGICTLFE